MQTIEELTNEILDELPEISGHTIQPEVSVLNGIVRFCDQDGRPLFEGGNRIDLEMDYQMFVNKEFPDYVPF